MACQHGRTVASRLTWFTVDREAFAVEARLIRRAGAVIDAGHAHMCERDTEGALSSAVRIAAALHTAPIKAVRSVGWTGRQCTTGLERVIGAKDVGLCRICPLALSRLSAVESEPN